MKNSNKFQLVLLLSILCAIWNPAQGRDFTAIDRILTDSSSIVGGGCAILIMNADSVLHKKGYGTFAMNPDTVVSIASATKWISAAVLGSIVGDGLLTIEDSIGKYLPVMSANNKGRITIRQCFSHTAGMKGFTRYIYDPSLTLQGVADSIALENLNISALPIGKKFYYGGLSMQVAGRAAEVIEGAPWDSVFARRIGTPLGMSRTRYFAFNDPSTKNDPSETDNPSIGGGIRSTLSDCGAFVKMVLNNGVYNGKRVLSSHIVEMMENDQTGNATLIFSPYQKLEQLDTKIGASGYGFGVWRVQTESIPEIEYMSQGSTGFAFWVNRTHGYGVVLSVKDDYQRLMGTLLTVKKKIHDIMSIPASSRGWVPAVGTNYIPRNPTPQHFYNLLGKKGECKSVLPFSIVIESHEDVMHNNSYFKTIRTK